MSLLLLTLLACNNQDVCCGGAPADVTWLDPGESLQAGDGGNLLVILLDDVGLDKIAAYDRHPEPACTPAINSLAAQGVRFTNAWVHPTCSPSRAGLLTGRHPTQTGIGKWIDPENESTELHLDELTVAELLSSSPDYSYTSAAVGKWHLVSWQDSFPAMHPLEQGFSYHAGSLGNPKMAYGSSGEERGYEWWEKSTNGALEFTDTYMTTDTIDEALGQIDALPEPWFLWVALNAPHEPLHEPPDELLYNKLERRPTDRELYDAALEAADREIGRLLEGIPEHVLAETTIVLLGDNGTIAAGIAEPWSDDRGKGGVYEGGVQVPFIVTGPYVGCQGCSSDALIQGTDLLATAAAIAGVEIPESIEADSVSLLPVFADPSARSDRPLLFTERLDPNGPGPYTLHHRAVRDEQWKYVHTVNNGNPGEALYYMEEGAFDEGENLMEGDLSDEAREQLNRYRGVLDDWSTGMTYGVQ